MKRSPRTLVVLSVVLAAGWLRQPWSVVVVEEPGRPVWFGTQPAGGMAMGKGPHRSAVLSRQGHGQGEWGFL
jgi:hypothetical protein